MIRISWTFDDGPTQYTTPLIEQLEKLDIRSVTLFVCRHNVYKHDFFKELRMLQDRGCEIAIHEIHPELDSINWLKKQSNSYGCIEDALRDFFEFYNELRSYGIHIRFVRLPGGELSELLSYLKLLGCPADENYHWAMQIIDGQEVPSRYSEAKKDYDHLIRALEQNNVMIWAGAPRGFPLLGGLPYHYNSWQAESAGISVGRGADNITFHQAKARREAKIIEHNFGVFEKTVVKVKQAGKPGSIVVLAHDTSLRDIHEIIADTKRMETVALNNNIRIEYRTMSSLYEAIR